MSCTTEELLCAGLTAMHEAISVYNLEVSVGTDAHQAQNAAVECFRVEFARRLERLLGGDE